MCCGYGKDSGITVAPATFIGVHVNLSNVNGQLFHAERSLVHTYYFGEEARAIYKYSDDGMFTVDELIKLPGIGRYTAGAIVSFAFDRPAPIVEANTLRLYSRLLALDENPRSTHGQRVLWAFAEHLLPRRSAGEFNQALMELGSQVCTPTEPECPKCPARSVCRAFAAGRQSEIPVAAPRQQITAIVEAAVAVRSGDQYLLRRNPEGQRWAGMWDFLRFPIEDADRHIPESGLDSTRPVPSRLARQLERTSQDMAGIEIRANRFLTELRHGVTRYRIRLQCFLAETDASANRMADGFQWVHPDAFSDYPLSVTGRKLARLLEAM